MAPGATPQPKLSCDTRYLPLFVAYVASSLGDVSIDELIPCLTLTSYPSLPLPAMLNFEDVEDRDGALNYCQKDEEIDPWSVRHLSSQVSGSRGTSGLLLA